MIFALDCEACATLSISLFFLRILQFEPDESDEKNMLLIWDFQVDHILSQRAIAQAPTVPSETCPEAPLLDVKKLSVDCNCSKFPKTSGIFFDRDTSEGNESENSREKGEVSDCVPSSLLKKTFFTVYKFSKVANFSFSVYALMCLRISAGQSLEPDLDIDTESSIQNLYPDGHRDDHSQNSDDESDEESVQHKLGFKCIGAAHEKSRQEYLRKAETKLHKEQVPVIVRLRPESTNEKDSNAIAIDMNYGTGWNCVGYIARELTEYLHPLINNSGVIRQIYSGRQFYRAAFLCKHTTITSKSLLQSLSYYVSGTGCIYI